MHLLVDQNTLETDKEFHIVKDNTFRVNDNCQAMLSGKKIVNKKPRNKSRHRHESDNDSILDYKEYNQLKSKREFDVYKYKKDDKNSFKSYNKERGKILHRSGNTYVNHDISYGTHKIESDKSNYSDRNHHKRSCSKYDKYNQKKRKRSRSNQRKGRKRSRTRSNNRYNYKKKRKHDSKNVKRESRRSDEKRRNKQSKPITEKESKSSYVIDVKCGSNIRKSGSRDKQLKKDSNDQFYLLTNKHKSIKGESDCDYKKYEKSYKEIFSKKSSTNEIFKKDEKKSEPIIDEYCNRSKKYKETKVLNKEIEKPKQISEVKEEQSKLSKAKSEDCNKITIECKEDYLINKERKKSRETRVNCDLKCNEISRDKTVKSVSKPNVDKYGKSVEIREVRVSDKTRIKEIIRNGDEHNTTTKCDKSMSKDFRKKSVERKEDRKNDSKRKEKEKPGLDQETKLKRNSDKSESKSEDINKKCVECKDERLLNKLVEESIIKESNKRDLSDKQESNIKICSERKLKDEDLSPSDRSRIEGLNTNVVEYKETSNLDTVDSVKESFGVNDKSISEFGTERTGKDVPISDKVKTEECRTKYENSEEMKVCDEISIKEEVDDMELDVSRESESPVKVSMIEKLSKTLNEYQEEPYSHDKSPTLPQTITKLLPNLMIELMKTNAKEKSNVSMKVEKETGDTLNNNNGPRNDFKSNFIKKFVTKEPIDTSQDSFNAQLTQSHSNYSNPYYTASTPVSQMSPLDPISYQYSHYPIYPPSTYQPYTNYSSALSHSYYPQSNSYYVQTPLYTQTINYNLLPQINPYQQTLYNSCNYDPTQYPMSDNTNNMHTSSQISNLEMSSANVVYESTNYPIDNMSASQTNYESPHYQDKNDSTSKHCYSSKYRVKPVHTPRTSYESPNYSANFTAKHRYKSSNNSLENLDASKDVIKYNSNTKNRYNSHNYSAENYYTYHKYGSEKLCNIENITDPNKYNGNNEQPIIYNIDCLSIHESDEADFDECYKADKSTLYEHNLSEKDDLSSYNESVLHHHNGDDRNEVNYDDDEKENIKSGEMEYKNPFVKYKDAPQPNYEHIKEYFLHENVDKKLVRHPHHGIGQCQCQIRDPDELEAGRSGCDEECINRTCKIECTKSICPINEFCTNRRFQLCSDGPIEPFYCGTDKGWGVRATKPIKPGTFITEYVGEIIDKDEFWQRSHRRSSDYEVSYIMNLQNNVFVDACKFGNYSRFVNHSCEPNVRVEKWDVKGKTRLGFFAIKNIGIDEELTINYQFQCYDTAELKCFCGMKKCSGIFGKVDNKMKDEFDNYENEMGRKLIDKLTGRVNGLTTHKHMLEFVKVLHNYNLDRDSFVGILKVLISTESYEILDLVKNNDCLYLLIHNMINIEYDDWELKMELLKCIDHLKLSQRVLSDSGKSVYKLVQMLAQDGCYYLDKDDDKEKEDDGEEVDDGASSDDRQRNEHDVEFHLPEQHNENDEYCQLGAEVRDASSRLLKKFDERMSKYYIPKKTKKGDNDKSNACTSYCHSKDSMSVDSYSSSSQLWQKRYRKRSSVINRTLEKLSKEEHRKLFAEKYANQLQNEKSMSNVEDNNLLDPSNFTDLLSSFVLTELTRLVNENDWTALVPQLKYVDLDKVLFDANGNNNGINNDEDDRSSHVESNADISEMNNSQQPQQYYKVPSQLPPNWKCQISSKSRRLYFYHPISQKTQWEEPCYPWDAGEEDPNAYCYNDAHLYIVTEEDVVIQEQENKRQFMLMKAEEKRQKRLERSLQKKMSLSDGEKTKIQFSHAVFRAVKSVMKPYFSSRCKMGRVKSKEDLKFLCQKFADSIISKEIKSVASLEDLELNANVNSKIQTYITKTMSNYGAVFKRNDNVVAKLKKVVKKKKTPQKPISLSVHKEIEKLSIGQLNNDVDDNRKEDGDEGDGEGIGYGDENEDDEDVEDNEDGCLPLTIRLNQINEQLESVKRSVSYSLLFDSDMK